MKKTNCSLPKMPMISIGGAVLQERSGTVSLECSPGRFVAHTERKSNMRKSSRLWWLHGTILLAAVVGCKNCGNSGGSCGQPGMNASPYGGAPVGGPTGAAGVTGYTQGGATQGFPAGSGYTGAPGMSGGSAFPSS